MNAPNTVTLPRGFFPPPPPQRHVMGPKNQKPMQARARSFDASLRALSSDRALSAEIASSRGRAN